jgi:ankyrin repeat protein
MTDGKARLDAFLAADRAYHIGDVDALLAALGNPVDFPNCLHPRDLGVGDRPLEYAIYRSPIPFIRTLLGYGANPNYEAPDGFPSLIAAISSGRVERHEIVELLLSFGADVRQRGMNDWTPLHCAVARRDLRTIELLLKHGADPHAKTRIDDCTSAFDDAEASGFSEAIEAILQSER